jgi:predicted protein tyrosine phosphatase
VITHVLSIGEPGSLGKPQWFKGTHLQLWFSDLAPEAGSRGQSRAPSAEDIRRGLNFLRQGWADAESRVLIHSERSLSRGPALAYLFLADQLGPGSEVEALRRLTRIPEFAPNPLVIRLGDTLLRRNGALINAVEQHNLRRYER